MNHSKADPLTPKETKCPGRQAMASGTQLSQSWLFSQQHPASLSQQPTNKLMTAGITSIYPAENFLVRILISVISKVKY